MNKKTLILCLLIPLLVGGLSTFLIKDSIALYEALNKPLLSTCMAFPIVWTILYLLMGLSSYLIVQSNSSNKEKALILYSFQLLINFTWPLFL